MNPVTHNLNNQFTEIPSRRVTVQAGQLSNLVCVYQGMEIDYPAWAPRRGSSHPDFPSMYLQTINREDRGGGLIEVSLTYFGTLLQQQQYTDLLIQIDLLTQSFSWSGPANVKGTNCQMTFDVQYTTISVSFAYNVYQYQDGAIFQSLAAGFTKIIDCFSNITTGPLAAGIYIGFPTIPDPIKPLMMLTRFNCQQQTPSSKTTQGSPDVVNTPGVWHCTETWQLAFNHGSLGFYEPNDVVPHP